MVVEISAKKCKLPSQAQGTTVEMPSARATFIHSKITSEVLKLNVDIYYYKWWFMIMKKVFPERQVWGIPSILWCFWQQPWNNAWNDCHETLDGPFEQQTQENIIVRLLPPVQQIVTLWLITPIFRLPVFSLKNNISSRNMNPTTHPTIQPIQPFNPMWCELASWWFWGSPALLQSAWNPGNHGIFASASGSLSVIWKWWCLVRFKS